MMLYTIAPNTPAQKPATWKPGQNDPTAQNSRPLITKMKRPSVRIVTGSVSRIEDGADERVHETEHDRDEQRGRERVDA